MNAKKLSQAKKQVNMAEKEKNINMLEAMLAVPAPSKLSESTIADLKNHIDELEGQLGETKAELRESQLRYNNEKAV